MLPPNCFLTDAPLAAQDDQTTSGLLQRGHIFSDFANCADDVVGTDVANAVLLRRKGSN
jgi:hypothetical protein